MHYKNDEEILYDCYMKLGEKFEAKKNKVSKKNEKELANGLSSSANLMNMRLSEEVISVVDLNKYLISAKGMYIQYRAVKGRNPTYVSQNLDKKMDKMIHAICEKEAEMILNMRLCETGGDRIDLESVFNQKKYLNQLGNTLARDILSQAIKDTDNIVGFIPTFYITETGKKYHRADCPYCKGRTLIGTTRAMVENQKLTPCKCLVPLKKTDEVDRTCVTAFVDESIHKVMWNEKGNKGKAGSYSYIICWGDLKSESELNEDRIITTGVDYIGEYHHIEKITETAIGKVLLTVAYDLEFYGPVTIYTDNTGAAKHWSEVSKNLKLATHFLSVRVSYVPREFNTTADKLGRTRMLLDVPINKYNEVVKKMGKIKDLEKKVKELEKERVAVTEIPEVIVAGKVVELEKDKEPKKVLSFDRFVKYFKEHFAQTTIGRLASLI
jgi:hypothetical protein